MDHYKQNNGGQDLVRQISQFTGGGVVSRHANVGGARPTSSSLKQAPNYSTAPAKGAKNAPISNKVSASYGTGNRPQTSDTQGPRLAHQNSVQLRSASGQVNVLKGGPLNKLLTMSNGEISSAVGVTKGSKFNKNASFVMAGGIEEGMMPQIERVFRNASNGYE